MSTSPSTEIREIFAQVLCDAEPGEDLVVVSDDIAPEAILAAYVEGVFPMGISEGGEPPWGWWSPDPRGVLFPSSFKASRSLRKSAQRFDVTVNVCFDDVVRGCADPGRDGRWIVDDIAELYRELHHDGHAHSIEVWREERLVGGLYGISVGGFFAGESMFFRERDASKVALMALCFLLDRPETLIDMQWLTPHLASLGGVEVSREEYLPLMRAAQALPGPECFSSSLAQG